MDDRTERRFQALRRRINREYAQAKQELVERLEEFTAKYQQKDKEKRKQLAEGKITEQQYKDWVRGQVFQGKRWQEKIDQVSRQLTDVDERATEIVNDERLNVFADNANWMNEQAEKNFGVRFDLYDSATVARLLDEQPNLLPPRRVKRSTDVPWYHKQVANAVTQGILQGDSIDKIADRIGETTGEKSRVAMLRNARTACTSAQNAGRIEAMHQQQGMGIEVFKKWIAAHDNRTREAHQEMDGQIVGVDEPFKSILGEILFPGDPAAHPANVYNCRCTLGYEYPKFQPRVNEESEAEEAEETKSEETQKADERSAMIQQIKAKLGNIPEQYRDTIFASIDNADEQMLGIISKTIVNLKEVNWTESDPHGCSHYNDGDGTITIVTHDDDGTDREPEDILRTFWHEYGHFVDDAEISKSGYGHQSEFSDYFFSGIKPEITNGHKWEEAAVADVNALFKKLGIDDKFQCVYNENMYCAAIFKNGEYYDARNPDFETYDELQNALLKWARDFSGEVEYGEYMRKKYGYPVQPNRNEYIESYFTPKRNLYRERELFKGATTAYNKAMEKYYADVEKFQQSHDMDKIFAEWNKLQEAAEKRKEAVRAATDSFDGGVLGSFSAFVLLGGHRPDYYARNQLGASEAIANVFSNLVTGNELEREAFMSLCPNLYNLIMGVIKK